MEGLVGGMATNLKTRVLIRIPGDGSGQGQVAVDPGWLTVHVYVCVHVCVEGYEAGPKVL